MTPEEKVEIIARPGPGSQILRVVEASEASLIYTSGYERVLVIHDGITHELLPVYASAMMPSPPARLDEDPLWDRDIDGYA
jgi:hypothetical protein